MSSDENKFSTETAKKLYKAGGDLFYLLNQGYNLKGASVFVGNHYLLSKRQRLALARAISSEKHAESSIYDCITHIIKTISMQLEMKDYQNNVLT